MKREIAKEYMKTLEELSKELHNSQAEMEKMLETLRKERKRVSPGMSATKQLIEKLEKIQEGIVGMSTTVDSEVQNATTYLEA